MDVYEILACELVGALVLLIICFGIAMIITAVGMLKNNNKEEPKNDPFREDEIAEGN